MAGVDSRQLQLQISASSELLIRNLKTADQAVADFRRQSEANLTGVDRAFGVAGANGLKKFQAPIAAVKGELLLATSALAGFGAIGAGAKFLQLAEQSKQLDAQLHLATQSFGSFNQGQRDTAAIADSTRSGIAETTKLYGTFIRAAEQTGHTQADAARATETFAKALKIGGAGAEESAAAILQFSQALGSGVLRGDEFNSIAEASPRVLKLLADALGVPQGALRGLAAEGKITGDVLFNALTNRKFTAGIDAEFKQLPETFGDAMTKVSNAAIATFGGFDRGGQFSQALVNFVDDGTTGFTQLTSGAESAGVSVRAAFAGLETVFDPFVTGVESATGFAHRKFVDLRSDISQLLGFVDELRNLPKSAADFIQGGNADFRKLSGYKSDIASSDLKGQFLRSYDASAAAANARLQAATQAGAVNRTGTTATTPASILSIQRDIAALEAQKAKASGSALALIKSEITERTREIGYLREGIAPDLAKQAAKADGTAATKATTTSERAIATSAKRAEKLWEEGLKKGREALDSLRDFQPRDVNGEADSAFARIGQNPAADIRSIVADADTRQGVKQDQTLAGFDRPMAAYRASLREAVGDTGKAFENVKVDALGSLEDGLTGIITGTKSVSSAFKEMSQTVIADIARVEISR